MQHADGGCCVQESHRQQGLAGEEGGSAGRAAQAAEDAAKKARKAQKRRTVSGTPAGERYRRVLIGGCCMCC